MRSIRTPLVFLTFLSLLTTSAHAAMPGSTEVSCSSYGSDALSCDQCFNGGTDYVGDTIAKAFDDRFISTSSDYLLLPETGGMSIETTTLQSSVSVGQSSDFGVTPPASVDWDIGPSGLGNVLTIKPGSSHLIAQMNGGLLFTSVSAGANPNLPALRFSYITNVFRYDIDSDTANGPAITHKECAFVSPRWCGDAIVSNGEKCDDGAQNGQPGKCNASCTDVNITKPSCDSMTVSVDKGDTPLNVSVTCNATDATTYHIDCGNGTVNLASTAICRYTEGGTFTPRCTINGNITSQSCTKSVVVKPTLPNPVCSTTITGTQTSPVTSVRPGLCDIGTLTTNSFNTNVVGTQTNYTWTCTSGTMTSPTCSANYTPPQPSSPDLALKKYINGSDAQNIGTAVDVTNNTTFSYTVSISNIGPGELPNSLTTVSDPLPAGVTMTATPTGAGWSCGTSNDFTSFTCTRNGSLAVGASFPAINIPVRVASAATYLTNTAEVSNPNDVLTANNTDPAIIHIIPPVIPPSCDSISVSPTTGTTPLNSVVSCNTTSATTVSIACGNGQVINSANGTCNYTTAGTFAPRCTVNGNISGASCIGSVTASLVSCVPGPTTGPQPNELVAGSTGLCQPGVSVGNFSSTKNGSTTNYSWSCGNSTVGGACVASHTPQLPSCVPGPTVGTQPNPLTVSSPGLCQPGVSVGNFTAATGALNVTYTWSCGASLTGGSCTAAYQLPVVSNAFDLSIKKYINGADAQNSALSATIPTNTAFTYTLVVRNEGPATATGVTTITDTLPLGTTLVSVANTSPWTCSSNIGSNSFSCSTSAPISPGTTLSNITVNATTTTSTGILTNIGIVSNPGDTNPANNTDPAVINVVAPTPTAFDLSIKKYVNNVDAQASVSAVNVGTSTGFTYAIQVRNEGPATATGTTTITDTLPAGTTLVSVPNPLPSQWTCSVNTASNSFSCTTNVNIASGTTLGTILVNATTTTSTGFITNTATVSNPGDTNPANNADPAVINVQGIVVPPTGPTCGSLSVNPTGTVSPNTIVTYTCAPSGYTGALANLEYNIKCTVADVGTWGSGATRICTAPSINSSSQVASCAIRDRTNPTVVFLGSDAGSCRSTLTTGPGTTGDEVVGKKCVNGIPTCASYKTKKACTDEGIADALCYGNDSVGQAMCSNQSLSCSTGPICTDPNGCSTSVSGYCGDGVLQPGAGEQCDVRGAAWCKACKMDGTITSYDPWTNPGENPITSMWIRIPTLAGTKRIGDGSFLKIPLDLDATTPDAYKVVVGQNTNVFTLADQLIYGLTTKYLTPIIVDADKMMCLQAHGNSLSSNDGVCTTFRQSGARITRISGTDYVVFGGGTYQERLANGTYANVNILNPVKEVLLFKGSSKYNLISTPSTTESLRNVFKGVNTIISGPQNGGITLFGCDGNNCGSTAITTLVNIPVRVSAAVVASIGSSANRSLEQFLSQATSPFAAFLGGTSININTSTTTNNTVNNTATVTIPVLPAKSGDVIAKSVTELETYAVNGNKNVLAINGKLTIDNCVNNTFIMDGVRTVVVTGDLVINCNIVYGSNDATSSWAWITKGGNIVVSNGVRTTSSFPITNLAGVYVSIAILDNTTMKGGKITYSGENSTQAILKIDGSMYGDATPLFGSRLYARANGAYDILTTGTILSYSNRALISPPPLLSQYLGAYKVVRVVQ